MHVVTFEIARNDTLIVFKKYIVYSLQYKD